MRLDNFIMNMKKTFGEGGLIPKMLETFSVAGSKRNSFHRYVERSHGPTSVEMEQMGYYVPEMRLISENNTPIAICPVLCTSCNSFVLRRIKVKKKRHRQ